MWIVLSIGVVMGILMFSFNMIVRQRNAQAHLVYYGQVAYGLAESGMNLSWNYVKDECNNKDSIFYELLIKNEVNDLVGKSIDITPKANIVSELLKDLNDSNLTVTAEIESADLMNDDIFKGLENVEKFVSLKIVSKGSFGGITKKVVETRKLRVQMDVLPVLSKFTLFIKKPEIEDAVSPGYNLFANDINGRPDTTTISPSENYMPLILYNSGSTTASLNENIDNNGWVFLGDDRVVKLNLTSGGDFQYGQYFHFYNFMQRDNAKQAGFINNTPPPFFDDDHSVNGSTHHYFLKHVLYGYFTVEVEPPGTMNKCNYLDYYFSSGLRTMRSSTLHLFGTPICPSPTKVLGNVSQSYPIYAAITVDIDGDGKRDGVVTVLPGIKEGKFNNLSQTNPIPSSTKNISNPSQQISLDTSILDYTNVFNDEDTFMEYSSFVQSESYNYSLDYMMNNGEFPPSKQALDPDFDYPNDGSDISFKCKGDKAYFEGDLNNITGEYLKERSFIECTSTAKFLREFVNGNKLNLGCHVYISGEDTLILPKKLEVIKGGAIICEKSINFNEIKCESDERLSLVSLTGNIYSAFDNSSENSPVEADLIALKGSVGSTNSNHEVHIKGTVAVKTLMPKDYKSGGTITYPIDASPMGTDREKYTKIHVPDLAEYWSF